MSSLRSISHHLFVAAVGQDDRFARKSSRQGSATAALAHPVRELPLEILEPSQPITARPARSLRTSETSGRG